MHISNQEFIDAGYEHFAPPSYEECITDIFQKIFRDGNKLYFITVERWDYTPVAGGRDVPIHYNFTSQLNTLDGRTLNVGCFDNFDIESAEKFYADLWNTGWFKIHEKV